MNAAGLAFALLAANASPQGGQQAVCGDRDEIVERLESAFGEDRLAMGLQGEAVIMEIFASRDTGSWTLLFTRANGVTCAMAAGGSWTEEPKTVESGGPDA